MRGYFSVDGRQLSYLDHGGGGRPLIALHGHYNEASVWNPLAEALSPDWRVLALDQRGHGQSDRAASYERDDYVSDLAAFHRHLDVGPVALLGHSMGGVNAYQYAARHPGRVSALIIEDIGAVVDSDWDYTLRLPTHAPTRDELVTALGTLAPYVQGSLRPSGDGWGLSFDIADTVASQKAVSADHWADWNALTCPTLLIHGTRSDELSASHAWEMAERLPALLVSLDAGHVVHQDAAASFTDAVRAFLEAQTA